MTCVFYFYIVTKYGSFYVCQVFFLYIWFLAQVRCQWNKMHVLFPSLGKHYSQIKIKYTLSRGLHPLKTSETSLICHNGSHQLCKVMQIRQMNEKVQAIPTVSSLNKLFMKLTADKLVVRRQVRKHKYFYPLNRNNFNNSTRDVKVSEVIHCFYSKQLMQSVVSEVP